ncbi:hypothetical protein SGLAD_v1c02590 [Spiroplasma gladiatoris]|uniref:Uncharacterized protein n=1 Tax=Spiroplasma gladiatoris TaxID=2143 RepID=A0A4P7AIA3_9MOLU|nr:hypothetical protein [Spiroplasma gladiatoris]QBQ07458.1 hypothetical protein SGLAD_v1c02590 [Spiroplasma gladiatoris]
MDLKSLEEFINKKGAYKLFNKTILKGYLAVLPNEIKDQNLVFEVLKSYTEHIIRRVKKIAFVSVDINDLIEMFEFEYFSDESLEIKHINLENEIKAIKINVIHGKENSLKKVTLTGSAIVKTFLRKDLNEILTKKELENIKFTLFGPTESSLLNSIAELNAITDHIEALKIEKVDKKNMCFWVNLNKGFNNPFYCNESIKINILK